MLCRLSAAAAAAAATAAAGVQKCPHGQRANNLGGRGWHPLDRRRPGGRGLRVGSCGWSGHGGEVFI